MYYGSISNCVYMWTECYSETDSESERSPSPHRRNKVSTVEGLHMRGHTTSTHAHTAFGVPFRLSYVSFWASESAVPHSASPQGEDQGAIIESFDRGQQRNRYVLCNSVSTLFLLSLLLAHFLSQWIISLIWVPLIDVLIICEWIIHLHHDMLFSWLHPVDILPNQPSTVHTSFTCVMLTTKPHCSVLYLIPSLQLCFPICVLRTSRWDGHDVKQHKGRRSFSDRPRAAVYARPLQEIVHSAQQEPCHQWEGAHAPGPAEHS